MRPNEEEHDPEKLADFSDKIMRPDEEEPDPEKLADFSDKIMRPNKEAHDPEKLADFSDKIMRPDEEAHDPEKLAGFIDRPGKLPVIDGGGWMTIRRTHSTPLTRRRSLDAGLHLRHRVPRS